MSQTLITILVAMTQEIDRTDREFRAEEISAEKYLARRNDAVLSAARQIERLYGHGGMVSLKPLP